MSEVTTEEFSKRLYNYNLLDSRQIEGLYSELGTRDVSLDDFCSLALRRELLTNWQIDRVKGGHPGGYFYGQYRVLYSVGAGTFARVYRAVHRETGQVRAVKVLRQRYSDDLATTEQFLKEAKTVIPLRHPSIVPIYEVDSERGRYYMVMEFVEGQNLRDFVRVHKHLPLLRALSVSSDIAAGLDYAINRNGITHRDLKLSNVLLSSSGRAKLVDFGLAGSGTEVEKKSDGHNPRSIDYAGLERATATKRDDKRSDLFFLGCMLYQMICGEPAMAETRERIQRLSVARYRNIPPITTHDTSLPHKVVVMVNKAIEIDPDARYQTPGEMLSDLKIAIEAIEAGDTQRYDSALEENEAYLEKKRLEESSAQEGSKSTLMLVESNSKIQNALRDRFKGLGYKVLIISDPKRALQRFENRFLDADEAYPADCVLFGCGELGYEALEAFNEFGESDYSKEVPAILLTNSRQHDFAEEGMFCEHRVNIQMPIKFRELRSTLKTLIEGFSPNPGVQK